MFWHPSLVFDAECRFPFAWFVVVDDDLIVIDFAYVAVV